MKLHNLPRIIADAAFLALWGAMVLWSAWFGGRRTGDFW